MPWNMPPPVDLDEVRRRLDEQERVFEASIARVRLQKDCVHAFGTTMSGDLGGDTTVHVDCTRCGFKWY